MWTGTDLALSLPSRAFLRKAWPFGIPLTPAFLVCSHSSNPARMMYFNNWGEGKRWSVWTQTTIHCSHSPQSMTYLNADIPKWAKIPISHMVLLLNRNAWKTCKALYPYSWGGRGWWCQASNGKRDKGGGAGRWGVRPPSQVPITQGRSVSGEVR